MNSATNQATSKTEATKGKGELRRGLKSRHLTMISLGGTIGTDYFLPAVVSSIQLDLAVH